MPAKVILGFSLLANELHSAATFPLIPLVHAMPVGISFMDVMALGVKHPLPTDIRELSKGKLLKKRLKAVNATRCCACGEGTTGGNRRAKAIPFVIRTYKTNGGDFFLMTWSGELDRECWIRLGCLAHTLRSLHGATTSCSLCYRGPQPAGDAQQR
jgi:hypothetical protein